MTVRLDRRGAVAVVTLDRPDRGNSLARSTISELGAVGEALRQETSVRVVVLTGSGERVFCAGADLKERATLNEEQIREQLRAYRSELGWLSNGPLPTVAAINGAALGGGLELALACDLRIAVPGATFALPETGLGIIPGAGGTQRLPRLIGEARAKEMILLARKLHAVEALAWGLIHRIADPTRPLLDQTEDWLLPITSGAPIAQSAARAAIARASALPLEEGLEQELALYEQCLVSEDRREALAAFNEKRAPRFRGC